jgi:hypothetical protein
MAIEKLKSHKSPGMHQIPAELIKVGGRTVRGEIHKLTISIFKKGEYFEEWKESIIILIYKRGDNTNCITYTDISILPPTYKCLSIILLSRLAPHAKEIIGDHQCEFQRNRSTTDHILFIRQMFQKKGNKINQRIGFYRHQESL